jgi:hypothetical protein
MAAAIAICYLLIPKTPETLPNHSSSQQFLAMNTYITTRLACLRPAVRWMIGDEIAGRIDYYRRAESRDSWGGPFNGQERRRELFSALVDAMKPKAIVETGTFRGTTTAYFAETGLPVYTIEAHYRNYGFARERLRRHRNVVMSKCDSREGLRRILRGALRDKLCEPLFFYLDAHWNANLPLAEELDIILDHTEHPLVMIDDFQVPWDNGYGYDDYGRGNALTLKYLDRHMTKYALAALFPKAASHEETGACRGCLVITNTGDAAAIRKFGLTRDA